MYFAEPMYVYVYGYSNMYVYSLFGKITLLDTIYSQKFLRTA